ncbi:glutamate racemase [Methylovulum psychrotolerans]|uniref:Glutamate racemase n=1 Tax=Methylovulum psychrotolerans TaxID=1704499 RepID=A0A2S5CL51_9GAMM|nr:glutamate racemase [Methylovulum psychrotolerans]POZ51543.1 glutamate racemase [Methylovulum psychrotolerans]
MTTAKAHHIPVPSPTAPIGVFDSGVGGLSVLKAVRQALPQEHLLYVADSANAPYGDRHASFIEDRALAMAQFLVSANAKAIVVACNTATVVAIKKLRALYPLPIVAMEPAIKPAVELSQSRVVGVLATRRTLESPSVAQLCRLYGQDTRIMLQPCPGLVEQVERGDADSDFTRQLLEHYLAPLLSAGADTLVLGCTHYPFLEPQIRKLVGPGVAIVESSAAVARQLQHRLAGSLNPGDDTNIPQARFFTTGSADQAHALVSLLWGASVEVHSVC